MSELKAFLIEVNGCPSRTDVQEKNDLLLKGREIQNNRWSAVSLKQFLKD